RPMMSPVCRPPTRPWRPKRPPLRLLGWPERRLAGEALTLRAKLRADATVHSVAYAMQPYARTAAAIARPAARPRPLLAPAPGFVDVSGMTTTDLRRTWWRAA